MKGDSSKNVITDQDFEKLDRLEKKFLSVRAIASSLDPLDSSVERVVRRALGDEEEGEQQ